MEKGLHPRLIGEGEAFRSHDIGGVRLSHLVHRFRGVLGEHAYKFLPFLGRTGAKVPAVFFYLSWRHHTIPWDCPGLPVVMGAAGPIGDGGPPIGGRGVGSGVAFA